MSTASPARLAREPRFLQADKTNGHGVFSPVTFVQRVETRHGQAPSGGCDAAKKGAEKRVDYSADYYFYGGGATPVSPGATHPTRPM